MEEAKGNCAGTEKECTGISHIPVDDEESDGAANHKPLNVNGRVRRSSKGNWTEEEDAVLQDVVKKYGGKSWKKVAKCLPGRTDTQCLHRWQKVLHPDLVKGPWSKEEDKLLFKLVEKQSVKKMKWAEIAAQLPGRMGKQCRERWNNHLNPEINKAAWTKEEEKILINAHSAYGNKWSEIAKILPGRSENSVKNHWNCSLKRKLINYPASGLALNHPISLDKDYEKLVELEQNLVTPNCFHEGKKDNSGNKSSFHVDLSPKSWSSPEKTNRSRTITLPPYYTDFCSINKPRRHSDTHENFEKRHYYTGLCYEPIKKDDLKVFLSTGKFPSDDSYIPPTSRSYTKVSSRHSPESILRSAAMSYDNVPSIIRKRRVNKVDILSVENQKLGKAEVVKSVGKCLEAAFLDA